MVGMVGMVRMCEASMLCASQRLIWARNTGEERGARLLQTINTTLFCSLKQGQSMGKKRRRKACGCFPVGVDKSNRCEMTYEPWGSPVGEALHLFLSQFTSQSDIIILFVFQLEQVISVVQRWQSPFCSLWRRIKISSTWL